jgi:outer membrane protein assembly factor BamB
MLVALVASGDATEGSAGQSGEGGVSAEWPSWRGDGSGASHSGAEMVDSLDQARLVWQSEAIGLSGCMYPGGNPGTGWCDPIIADGRVFVSWFRRAGPDLVDMHKLAASRGWASLIEPPDDPEAFARGGGHRTSLPSKEMCAIQRFVRADDVVDCFDDRTGKRLWQRVFPNRGMNHVRVYSPLMEPCVRDGVLYALGSSGRVYALDAATGRTKWESDIGVEHEQLEQYMEIAARSRHRAYDSGWLNTGLVVADGVVALGSVSLTGGKDKNTDLVGLDAATGRRLWRVPDCLHDPGGTAAVWRHAGREYFLAAGQRMALIEPRTGKELWSLGGKDDVITEGCAPAVSGDYVVVAKNVLKTVGLSAKANWRGPSGYRISLTGAERVWALPMVEGISLIAPSIMGRHAYVCVKGGVDAVELETGKEVGQPLSGFSSAYAGYAVGDGLVFRLGKAAKGFPEMKVMEGTLPGSPDFGEIHAPATAHGRVYWRGKRSVWCYDFRKNPPAPSSAPLPAARDLSAIKDDAQQLAAVIEKEGWPTRATAAGGLRLLGGKGKSAAPVVQKALLAAIAAKDWGDVDLLIDTLLAIDPAAARPAAPELAKLLESTDEPTWRLGYHGLALLGPQAVDAVPALVKHLDPTQPEPAALAARAAGRVGPDAKAAATELMKCLVAKDEALAFQAAKALCHMQPGDAAMLAATVDAVLAHPWFVKMPESRTPPRRDSYKAVALSLLGKDAVPLLLDRAKAVIAAGESPVKKGAPAPRVNYASICEMASAAFVMDPRSASDFLPLMAKIPNRNPPVMDKMVLSLTEKDLDGTLDQRDPLGYVKAKGASAEKEAEE